MAAAAFVCALIIVTASGADSSVPYFVVPLPIPNSGAGHVAWPLGLSPSGKWAVVDDLTSSGHHLWLFHVDPAQKLVGPPPTDLGSVATQHWNFRGVNNRGDVLLASDQGTSRWRSGAWTEVAPPPGGSIQPVGMDSFGRVFGQVCPPGDCCYGFVWDGGPIIGLRFAAGAIIPGMEPDNTSCEGTIALPGLDCHDDLDCEACKGTAWASVDWISAVSPHGRLFTFGKSGKTVRESLCTWSSEGWYLLGPDWVIHLWAGFPDLRDPEFALPWVGVYQLTDSGWLLGFDGTLYRHGSLLGSPPILTGLGNPSFLNESGTAVGQNSSGRPAIWRNGALTPIDTVIDWGPAAGTRHVVAAWGIADGGGILAQVIDPANGMTVAVLLNPPAHFELPLWPPINLPVSFTSPLSGPGVTWRWDFGDGETSSDQNPSHTYLAPGAYEVTLVVSNGGSTSSTTRRITVVAEPRPAPTASFSFEPESPASGGEVEFTDTSTGAPVYWRWTFGDGGESLLQRPKHAFAVPGRYEVTLDVESELGRSTISRTVMVRTPPVPKQPRRVLRRGYRRGSGIAITLPGGTPLTLVSVPAGTFTMGAPASERGSARGECPQHGVEISAFSMGRTEVTQAQWQAVMRSSPSAFPGCGGDCPVDSVSWEDICGTGTSCGDSHSFIKRLNDHLFATGQPGAGLLHEHSMRSLLPV